MIQLSDSELKEVAQFWGAYLNSGGTTDEPSLFQLEALNDKRMRDAFILWSVGAKFPEPEDHNGEGVRFQASKEAFGWMGPVTDDPEKVMAAMNHAIGVMDKNGEVEPEDTDAGTVIILSMSIWFMLLGRWEEARHVLNELALLNLKWAALKAQNGDHSGITHRDPLSAFAATGAALSVLAETDPEKAFALVMQCFSIQEGSVTHEYAARERTIALLRRIVQKEDANNATE